MFENFSDIQNMATLNINSLVSRDTHPTNVRY